MGDRANVCVKQDEGFVFLYTHWAGTELAQIARVALAKRWRWDDPAYLARIIFDEMTTHARGTETGYGISTTAPDNEHRLIVVDCGEKRIGFTGAGWEADPEKVTQWWAFEDYIALDPEELQAAYDE